jgi:membrane associated rhomboid family serine protease
MTFQQEPQAPPPREPIFNIPGSLAAIVTALVLVHLVRVYLLSDALDEQVLRLFAFDPARYDSSFIGGGAFPGGAAANGWTFVTYALLHADTMHIGFNILWLLPFGAALARRFGGFRFILFLAVAAVGGALAHLLTHQGAQVPMIGASASVSGAMAGAMRFAFQRNGPISLWRAPDNDAYRVPAISLVGMLSDTRVLGFLAVWFGTNILFGMGTVAIGSEAGQSVAWQAHIGGFLAGLLLFSWFDPPRRVAFDERA